MTRTCVLDAPDPDPEKNEDLTTEPQTTEPRTTEPKVDAEVLDLLRAALDKSKNTVNEDAGQSAVEKYLERVGAGGLVEFPDRYVSRIFRRESRRKDRGGITRSPKPLRQTLPPASRVVITTPDGRRHLQDGTELTPEEAERILSEIITPTGDTTRKEIHVASLHKYDADSGVWTEFDMTKPVPSHGEGVAMPVFKRDWAEAHGIGEMLELTPWNCSRVFFKAIGYATDEELVPVTWVDERWADRLDADRLRDALDHAGAGEVVAAVDDLMKHRRGAMREFRPYYMLSILGKLLASPHEYTVEDIRGSIRDQAHPSTLLLNTRVKYTTRSLQDLQLI